MKTILVLLISFFSFICLADNNKEIRLFDINGIILVNKNKEYTVATNNQLLQVNDRILVTKNSTGKILYNENDCVVNVPEYSIVDIQNTCNKTQNAISSLNSEVNYNWVKGVVVVAGLIGVGAVIYNIYHDDDDDDNVSLE